MSDIREWDNLAGGAGNNVAPPDGAPEGMNAAALNDVMREYMAGVRRHYEDHDWVELEKDSVPPLFVSATEFSVTGDQTATYNADRRVQARGAVTTTIFGTIVSVLFSTVTTVTVIWDSGALINEPIRIFLGAEVTGQPIGEASVAGIQALIDAAIAANPVAIVGEIRLWSAASTPSGWHLCDNQELDRTVFANLFGIIGTSYGVGNGTTTYNVPDFRGRAPFGEGIPDSDNGKTWALAEKPLTGAGGEGKHAQIEAEMPAHDHGVTGTFRLGTSSSSIAGGPAVSFPTNPTIETFVSQGSGDPANITPSGLGINFIIFGPD